MRVSLRLGLILAIAAILLSTLAVSALLTYRHAVNKLDVEMKSTLSAVQSTIRVALQDIAEPPGESRHVARLIRTYDESRHVRVELKSGDGRTLLASKLAPPSTGMPDWFFNFLAPHEETAIVQWPGQAAGGAHIVVTADPRNEAGEVWGDIKLHLSTLALFCLLTLALLSGLLSYALSPLGRLLQAFERIGSGRFGETIPVSGPKEMEQLAEGFNRMTGLLAEIEDKNRKLDQQLEAVQEEERANLARDLHDEVGPLLFSVDVDATTIRNIAEAGGQSRIAERAAAIQGSIALVKETVRTILWQLRPGLLLDLGLKNALENLFASLKSRHPEVTLKLDVTEHPLKPQIQIALLAIVREAVNNALKHGRPSHIEVVLKVQGETVECAVRNDGERLADAGVSAGSLGVVSMRERARLAGGTLDITDTANGRGVEVKLSLPLNGPGAIPVDPAASTRRLQ